MSSESLPKEFEKTTEVLPFTKYGISTFEEFKKVENDIQHREWLKKLGLSSEEMKLYEENEAGLLDQRKKVESSVLKDKLEVIYDKINNYKNMTESSNQTEEQPSTSNANIFERLQRNPVTFYPDGHPMNEIKELEESLFGHLKDDDVIPFSKRRKILRRLERKKERVLSQEQQLVTTERNSIGTERTVTCPGSLWDVKEVPVKVQTNKQNQIIGPRKQTMYTIKDNKIVRLQPVNREQDEYEAEDIVMPVNSAEEQLLEGTKMSVDDIKKIERFKDYEPGIPSKVLYLKNIAPSVTQEQLALLFIQFQLDNGGPVDVRLMSGRMRGQAFVAFQSEDLAIRALEEVNGTILSGRPIVAQFGRNSNRVQDEHR